MENGLNYEASIAYLKTVLGIDSFISPTTVGSAGLQNEIGDLQTEQETLSAAESQVFGVTVTGPEEASFAVVVDSTFENPQLAALFARMLTAMKQESKSVFILQLHETAKVEEAMGTLAAHPREAVLVFGADTAELLSGGKKLPTAQWLAPLEELPVLITYSLSEIESNPGLKKTVWQHLQMIMLKLGQK